MGISAVRGSSPVPQPQRMDTQRALELRQQNRPHEAARHASSSSVARVNQTRTSASPKDKGSHVDVRA